MSNLRHQMQRTYVFKIIVAYRHCTDTVRWGVDEPDRVAFSIGILGEKLEWTKCSHTIIVADWSGNYRGDNGKADEREPGKLHLDCLGQNEKVFENKTRPPEKSGTYISHQDMIRGEMSEDCKTEPSSVLIMHTQNVSASSVTVYELTAIVLESRMF